MNSQQWRKAGYKTIFRDGLVYLYRPMSKHYNPIVAHCLPVNNGGWMEETNINKNWKLVELTDKRAHDFANTAAACYCDNGVGLCDFCSGIRSAPEKENTSTSSKTIA